MNAETPGRFGGGEELDETPARQPRRWPVRLGKGLLGLVLLTLLVLAGFVAFIDTGPGHRFIADRIAAQAPRSGLAIRIGRIDGSIWGRARLVEVKLFDPDGLFAQAPAIDIAWDPLGWLANRLEIDELDARLVVLHRLPRLRPSVEPQPILPGFDVGIGRFRVEQFRFEPGIVGARRLAALAGSIDIRAGRALVALTGQVRGGGDRLAILLDAEPDRDRFDLDVRIDSPARGVLGALVGTQRPLRLLVEGDGRWRAWGGTARLDLSGRRAAQLALRAEAGRYSLTGALAPAQFLTGKRARLTAPRLLVNASARLTGRRLDGELALRSAALKVAAGGVLDLGRGAFERVRIGADLLQPVALFPDLRGRAIRLTILLNGPFRGPDFAYRLTSPELAFDRTGFQDVRAEGRGHFGPAPVSVPTLFTARRVTGVGDVAGNILANLRVRGVLKLTATRLTADDLAITSDKLSGKGSLLVDFLTGQYDLVLSGGLSRYSIPGLGIVDVLTDLKVVPDPARRGILVTGRGRAWVRRFDNRLLSSLAGGLPQIETGLTRGADGILRLTGLQLRGPTIRIAGSGYRRRDGSFFFEGSGAQGQYGAFAMRLDGRIERPKLAFRLARPHDALGLADVLLQLGPTASGFAYRAAGGSTLGPFASRGAILLPPSGPATIQVASLNVSGTQASGALRAHPGGFTGKLDVGGGGVGGALLFSPVGTVQRIEAHLTAENGRFLGPPAIAIRRGKLDVVMLLNPGATSIEGSISARGLSRGALSLARLDARASLRGGAGQVRADFAGTRGRDFTFQAVAQVSPDRWRVTGRGSVDRRPLELAAPAELIRADGGWRLSPTSLRFAGGNANLSGRFGARATELDARMDAMPLTALDIAYPRLGLGGSASGSLSYREAAGAPPSGTANLRIRGLTRAGLVLSSRPLDIGVAARLSGSQAALRAIAVSEGRMIGRAQARLAPIGGAGSLAERLARAPLFAQLRYNGAADTLWRLTGVELLDLSGPVAVGADARGTFADPQIRGSVRTTAARLESPVLGTIVEKIAASGRFGGSRLVIDSFAGATKSGGTVSGRGAFDLSATRGFGIDLAVQADKAQLIDRDDLKAQVSGPFTIRSDGSGGTIAGNLRLDSAAFRLGSATAAAQVARLPVREINRPDEDEEAVPAKRGPWRLELGLAGDDRIRVTGLGLTSEWGANLRIGGAVAEPRLTGQAELVRGNYDFAGRRFDLERGTIRFAGEAPVNPVLDIVAEGGIRDLNATIRVTGRGQAPEIAFASTPALPQDELLSRLLFGTSITDLSAPEALQLAAAVASLNQPGGGLDPINRFRAAIGLDRLRILPADIATGQGTSIAAGKYLGRQVYVEVITDGRGYSATRVEYQITRWLSLLSSISTIGRESVNVRVSRDY